MNTSIYWTFELNILRSKMFGKDITMGWNRRNF